MNTASPSCCITAWFVDYREIDGHDLMDLLLGRVEQSNHEFLFHYCNSYMNAVRWHLQNSKLNNHSYFRKKNSWFLICFSTWLLRLLIWSSTVFSLNANLLRCSFIPSFSGSSVWKAFYFTPNFYPENATACFHTHVCFCTSEHVTYHHPPLLFDLLQDPSETTPLTPDTEPAFHAILSVMEEAVETHKRTVKPVESQLSLSNVAWKPWLQPCRSTFGQLCQ